MVSPAHWTRQVIAACPLGNAYPLILHPIVAVDGEGRPTLAVRTVVKVAYVQPRRRIVGYEITGSSLETAWFLLNSTAWLYQRKPGQTFADDNAMTHLDGLVLASVFLDLKMRCLYAVGKSWLDMM